MSMTPKEKLRLISDAISSPVLADAVFNISDDLDIISDEVLNNKETKKEPTEPTEPTETEEEIQDQLGTVDQNVEYLVNEFKEKDKPKLVQDHNVDYSLSYS